MGLQYTGIEGRDCIKQVPRSEIERGLPNDREQYHLLFLFEALSGLSFVFFVEEPLATCVARLQVPFFHFKEGSGHAAQNQPVGISEERLQPLHCSTISWQIPPL